jgi:hypothetical protein
MDLFATRPHVKREWSSDGFNGLDQISDLTSMAMARSVNGSAGMTSEILHSAD